MDDNFEIWFTPPIRTGLIFHFTVAAGLLTIGGLGLWQVIRAGISPTFLLTLALLLILLGLSIWLLYRGYALYRAYYRIFRAGIELNWGLRNETIPIDQIIWIGLATELGAALSFPALRWPGAVLGKRHPPAVQPFSNQQAIEYLAANTHDLVVIVTPDRAFAITPQDPRQFIDEYTRQAELGVINAVDAESSYPAFLLAQVWQIPAVRLMLIASLLLSLILLIVVTAIIPLHPEITLGFYSDGRPRPPVETVRLLLLPVLNAVFVLVNFWSGLFFFRREINRPLAYLSWGVSVLTPALFLIGVLFSLRAG